MKNKISYLFVFMLALVSSPQLWAQATLYKFDTSVFPKPEKGFVQYVIDVPHSNIDEDATKKIEISVGKYSQVDSCNSFFLNGELKSEELKGFGYTYYTFKTNGTIMSTSMGCLDNSSKNKFVTSKPTMVDYNGRMSIVIYAPEGYDVQYKIYKAQPESYRAYEIKQKNK